MQRHALTVLFTALAATFAAVAAAALVDPSDVRRLVVGVAAVVVAVWFATLVASLLRRRR